MYQDPSIGEIKVYYVVTKIIVLNSTVGTVRIDNYQYADIIRLTIGHFRITSCVCFKTSLRAKSFL